MTSLAVGDIGHWIIKGRGAGREVEFPHALKSLTDREWENLVTRAGKSGVPEDYIKINGQPYVVGLSAEKHGVPTKKSGAARYTPDYYGCFAAALMARLFKNSADIEFFGSHPPGDVAFRDALMRAVQGEWFVEVKGRERKFNVTYVNAYDEPHGGYYNVVLNESGKSYQRRDIKDGRTLVLDLGGGTFDLFAIDPGGEVDYGLNVSVPMGVGSVLRDVDRSIRENNDMRDLQVLPADRVREALRTNIFRGGGKEIDCTYEVDEATNILLNRVSDVYQSVAGGAYPWDTLILTGGGSGLLYNRLLPILKHNRIVMADQHDEIHRANVRGGEKYWKLLEELNLL